MFSSMLNRSDTPNRLAVAGMSCIRPAAPFLETAWGFQPDSIWMTASTSSTGTSKADAYDAAHRSENSRTPAGSAAQAAGALNQIRKTRAFAIVFIGFILKPRHKLQHLFH